MTSKLLGAALAVVAACVSGPAAAAVYTVTYSGVFEYGTDDNVFGVNGDLTNLGFVAVYTIDPQKAGATVVDTPPHSYIQGDYAASPVSATLTVNGVTLSFGGTFGQAWETSDNLPGFGYDNIRQQAKTTIYEYEEFDDGSIHFFYRDALLYSSVNSYAQDIAEADFRTAPPAFTLDDRFNATGTFGEYVYLYDPDLEEIYLARSASGRFRITSVQVAAAAVPEPTTWALMILGFGGAGAGLRLRRPLSPA